MMDAVKSWWSGLSMRERRLVGVAGALALAVLGWALGRPAVAAFFDLETRHRAAIEREGRVAAQLLWRAYPLARRSRGHGAHRR